MDLHFIIETATVLLMDHVLQSQQQVSVEHECTVSTPDQLIFSKPNKTIVQHLVDPYPSRRRISVFL
jgi:hypothetical protein